MINKHIPYQWYMTTYKSGKEFKKCTF